MKGEARISRDVSRLRETWFTSHLFYAAIHSPSLKSPRSCVSLSLWKNDSTRSQVDNIIKLIVRIKIDIPMKNATDVRSKTSFYSRRSFNISVFILCWSPYIVFDLLQVYGYVPETQTNIAVATFIQSLTPLNSAANPIIYCLFSTSFCKTVRWVPKTPKPLEYSLSEVEIKYHLNVWTDQGI